MSENYATDGDNFDPKQVCRYSTEFLGAGLKEGAVPEVVVSSQDYDALHCLYTNLLADQLKRRGTHG